MKTGQIVKALSGFYYILSDNEIYQTRGRGKFRKQQFSPLVGDIVDFDYTNQKEGRILDVHSRKNEMIRPSIANIDCAVIVMSVVEPNFSLNLLDRYIVTLEKNNIAPIIYVSKGDLSPVTPEMMDMLNHYEQMGYPVVLGHEDNAFENLQQQLKSKLSVLMGQSGAGKSTLLNQLLPTLQLETAEISSYLNRGKHTTRHVEIHDVNGCYIADTPGFSAIDLSDITLTELPTYFEDFNHLSNNCRFRGCVHLNEPGCAVKEALNSSYPLTQRYQNYLQFRQEIELRPIQYGKK
ncbi:ribosome small subunit-dependent GTPase A [Carnobacteriaceae bacterium zg-C25]|nr:ribosome small subunit-dependent GTPase A [Carnobacteriaceae bacterium zg-C25]